MAAVILPSGFDQVFDIHRGAENRRQNVPDHDDFGHPNERVADDLKGIGQKSESNHDGDSVPLGRRNRERIRKRLQDVPDEKIHFRSRPSPQ